MTLKFATKRDRNGNRYYRIVNTDQKQYSKQPSHWFCREDFIEVSKNDLHRLETFLDDSGYTEIDKAL